MHTLAVNYFAFFVAATVIVWFVLSRLSEQSRREREAFARALPCVARVLKVANSTPSRSYGAIVMDLLIQVHRPGLEPYELSTMWSVEPGSVSKLQAGQTFNVKVDPQDRNRIYSAEKWAHSLGVMKTPIDKYGA